MDATTRSTKVSYGHARGSLKVVSKLLRYIFPVNSFKVQLKFQISSHNLSTKNLYLIYLSKLYEFLLFLWEIRSERKKKLNWLLSGFEN